jgi:transposase
MRGLLDGLFYLVRTGCQWRHLPPPPRFPPWPTVYGYFRAFLAAGVWESIRHHFVVMLREGEGREASPSAAIIDTHRGAPPARSDVSSGGVMLTDEQWTALEPLVERCRPPAKTPPRHLRRTVGAIVWRHRNGAT